MRVALTSCRKLALRVLQKKGTDHFRRNHTQVRAERGEQVAVWEQTSGEGCSNGRPTTRKSVGRFVFA
jgi:hypothetical protein